MENGSVSGRTEGERAEAQARNRRSRTITMCWISSMSETTVGSPASSSEVSDWVRRSHTNCNDEQTRTNQCGGRRKEKRAAAAKACDAREQWGCVPRESWAVRPCVATHLPHVFDSSRLCERLDNRMLLLVSVPRFFQGRPERTGAPDYILGSAACNG